MKDDIKLCKSAIILQPREVCSPEGAAAEDRRGRKRESRAAWSDRERLVLRRAVTPNNVITNERGTQRGALPPLTHCSAGSARSAGLAALLHSGRLPATLNVLAPAAARYTGNDS